MLHWEVSFHQSIGERRKMLMGLEWRGGEIEAGVNHYLRIQTVK